MADTIPTWYQQARRGKQVGLGLVAVLLFIAIVGGLTAFGFMEWRQRESIQTARQEKASLAQADAALLTFATAFNRLPCPDTDRDGLEDCAAGAQKGWYPSRTLALAGADSGVVVGQLRYIVQRSDASFDLAATVSDTWRPLLYRTTFAEMRTSTVTGGDYPATILTLSDLCERIKLADTAAAVGVTGAMAQVASAPARAVAYALVHPGLADADGNGSVFDGVNGDNGNTVEDSARKPVLGNYDDLVLERSFASLQSTFNCASLAQSINTVALGLDVVSQVDGMRQDNIDAAKVAVGFAAAATAITVVQIGKSIIDIASDSSNAAAEFAACVASLGVAVNFCSAAPMHVSTAILAGVSLGLKAGALVANIAAVVLAGSALAVADKTSTPATNSCPVIDLNDTLAKSIADRDSARLTLAQQEAELAQKRTDLTNANTAKTTVINALYSSVSGNSTLTGVVDSLINNANGSISAQQARETAVARYDNANTNLGNLDTQIARYDDLLARRPILIPQLEANIETLKLQIAAETDATLRANLVTQLNKARADLSLLTSGSALIPQLETQIVVLDQQILVTPAGPVRDKLVTQVAKARADLVALNNGGSLQLERDTAVNSTRPALVTDRDNAQNAVNTADANIVSTRVGYQTAYARLFLAGSGTLLRSLMGWLLNDGSFQPDPDSRFSVPAKLTRVIAALEPRVNKSRDRLAQAERNLLSVQAQVSSPAPCNITGTGVRPWDPVTAEGLLANTDAKGGTR